jgi:hypothetical protein
VPRDPWRACCRIACVGEEGNKRGGEKATLRGGKQRTGKRMVLGSGRDEGIAR